MKLTLLGSKLLDFFFLFFPVLCSKLACDGAAVWHRFFPPRDFTRWRDLLCERSGEVVLGAGRTGEVDHLLSWQQEELTIGVGHRTDMTVMTSEARLHPIERKKRTKKKQRKKEKKDPWRVP